MLLRWLWLLVLLLTSIVFQARAISSLPKKKIGGNNRTILKQELLQLVQNSNYGLNSSKDLCNEAEDIVDRLSTLNLVKSPADAFYKDTKKPKSPLYGQWDLKFTTAPDVLSIGKIPGVKLEYVGQNITNLNTITNIIEAAGFLADSRQEVVVRAAQTSPFKVGLRFDRSRISFNKIFGRDFLFGKSVSDLISPIEFQFNEEQFAKARARSNRPDPAFEILYLDNDLRIQRTAEGFLFIATKSPSLVSAASVAGMSEDISLVKDGLGPWLNQKLGADAMKILGLVSLTPYLLFFYRFITKS